MGKFVVFRLGGEEFGVGIESVVEILRSQKVNPLPELPDFFSGVITVRGAVIPLVDMRRRFGISPSKEKERIIIVKSTDEKIGIVVDEVFEIASFGHGEIIEPPSIFKGLKTEYLAGIGKKDLRVVVILKIESLLTAKEKIMLESSREAIKGSG